MTTKSLLWKSLTLVIVFMMALSPVFAIPRGATASPDAPAPAKGSQSFFAKALNPVTYKPEVKGIPAEQALEKIHPELRATAEKAAAAVPGKSLQAAVAAEPLLVQVMMNVPAKTNKDFTPDLSKYMVDGKLFERPAILIGDVKFKVAYGYVKPTNLLKIASEKVVTAVMPVSLEETMLPDVRPADDTTKAAPKLTPEELARIKANADKLRLGAKPWSEAKAFGDGRERMAPTDWHEATLAGPHGAAQAWERGYDGTGVTVAINDDGVDFGHPDLMGTQKIYINPYDPSDPYNGWPMAFSPISTLLYFLDSAFGSTMIAEGFPSAGVIDTSALPRPFPCEPDVPGTLCFNYTRLDYGWWDSSVTTFKISADMSKSGRIHAGTHPDADLVYVWGETVAVLVTDPNEAGVYDTVYVDLDNDYDFRNEKPLTRADVSSPATLAATYNNMVAYRDFNEDGLADVSGGALYFIGDGETCLPASDWMYDCDELAPGFMVPGNGDIVAFTGANFGSGDGYSHGTQCASNVAGQGVINGLVWQFNDLPPYPGVPEAAVYGMAPGAKIVDVSNIYYNFESSVLDAYLFAAFGYNGIPLIPNAPPPFSNDWDAIQITSNSYGSSDVTNDGWDFPSQMQSSIMRYLMPTTQSADSTGNGAPGYGTTSPPSADVGISVGASTQMGSTGWDSLGTTDQIMQNDVSNWSNRGPGATGTAGVDVVADGAYAAGDYKLNTGPLFNWGVLDGNLAWDTWGGTSRSAPVAAGILALIYQAYAENVTSTSALASKYEDLPLSLPENVELPDIPAAPVVYWPSNDIAKALLKSSATDLDYDIFAQGAGSVNADQGTLVASGDYGTVTFPDEWNPGDYRGEDFPGFAHVVVPGNSYDEQFEVVNPSDYPVTVDIEASTPTKIGEANLDFTITPAMRAASAALGNNSLRVPQYIIPITATEHEIDWNSWWDNVDVPDGTDLMAVRFRIPYNQFDPDNNYTSNNTFRLIVYNWEDKNDDHGVWHDANNNQVVDYTKLPIWNQIDGIQEVNWANSEIDQYEYGRFGYLNNTFNMLEVWVRNPLERMKDGMFIGLVHTGNVQTTNVSITIDFYQNQPVEWLDPCGAIPLSPELLGGCELTIMAHDSESFYPQVNVPADMPPGTYQAAIKVTTPGLAEVPDHTSVIPVSMSVVDEFQAWNGEGTATLGGPDAFAYDEDKPYNNGAVRGSVSWTWRPETGDWRFFMMDVQNTASTYMSEDFTSGIPLSWDVDQDGGDGYWEANSAYCGYPNDTGGTGDFATANSDCWEEGFVFTTTLMTPEIDLTGATNPALLFRTNFWVYDTDTAQVMIMDELGNHLETIRDYGGEDYVGEERLDLSAFAGQKIKVCFLYTTGGEEYQGYWNIDNFEVVELVEAPGTHLLLRDEWDEPAPHNDIDTIVLGPQPSNVVIGPNVYGDPGYNGPYTLDEVARSADALIRQGTWAFETSSGGNVDWVPVPFQEGLHNILQHQVLAEGDNVWVQFEKQLGLLREDVHELEINTFVDEGFLGTINLSATLELDEVVAEGYLLAPHETTYDDEPLPLDGFVGEPFLVEDGLFLSLETASADVSDLDLFLYYCEDGVACEDLTQVGSSAGGTSDESIYIGQPDDGYYLVYIENYSQQEGHFDMYQLWVAMAGGITTEVTPDGDPVAAGDPFSVDVYFDYAMEPFVTYPGVVFIGVPDAPYLKSVPLAVTRWPAVAAVGKGVDVAKATQEQVLNYGASLYNLGGLGYLIDDETGLALETLAAQTQFVFSDTIPVSTTYISDAAVIGGVPDGSWYNGTDALHYEGLLPISEAFTDTESFEHGGYKPSGWTLSPASGGWEVKNDPALAKTGNYSIFHNWSPNYQSHYVISPWVEVNELDRFVSFQAWSDTTWPGATVWLYGLDPDGYLHPVWNMLEDEDWPNIHDGYHNVTVDLYDALGEGDWRLAWRYRGSNGQFFVLDDVILPGAWEWLPSATVQMQAEVDAATPDGTVIKNRATLDAAHLPPVTPAEQNEPQKSALAQTAIGDVDLIESYKEAQYGMWPGGFINYEIHIINNGTAPALGVEVWDYIPTGTTYVSHFPGQGPYTFHYSVGDNAMWWNGDVLPGQEIVLYFIVKVDENATGMIENTATLGYDGDEWPLDWETVVQNVPYYLPVIRCSGDCSGLPTR